jgi:acyl-CoA dehydrogenase
VENRLLEEGDGLKVRVHSLVPSTSPPWIGEVVLDSMNPERILIAAECIGDAKYFIERAANYSQEREVFGKPIGQNQAVQFPIADAYIQTRAAELMVQRAATMYDSGVNCGEEANIAK